MKQVFIRVTAGLVSVAMLGAIAFVAVGLIHRDGIKISALVDSVVGLYPGSDVQILGVPVGVVTAVEPEGDHVRVRMELDRGQRAAADTGAVIVAPTLVSDRFVQLTEPWVGGPELEDGAVIEDTAIPVEVDDIYASLIDLGRQLGPEGLNENGALSEFLDVMAANLDGQGEDINKMIKGFGEASAAVAGFDTKFFETLENLDVLNKTLLEHDEGVAGANRQLQVVASSLAADRDDLAEAIGHLGHALADLEAFIRDNRGELASSVKALRGPTKLLVDQQQSLEEMVRTVPVLLEEFTAAYDPRSGTVRGRGNPNEVGVWSTDGLHGRTSRDAPPGLFSDEKAAR